MHLMILLLHVCMSLFLPMNYEFSLLVFVTIGVGIILLWLVLFS